MKTEKGIKDEKLITLEKKLQQCQEDVNDCLKEKEDFISMAAHELKAPLRKITTFSEQLVKKSSESLNEQALPYLQRIENNIKAMQSLVDDLSELSKIESGANFAKFNLNLILKEVLQELTLKIKAKNATIHLPALPSLECNFKQMKEVFKNLLDNSLKFQPKNQEPQIQIELNLLSAGEKNELNLPVKPIYYKISVSDNGIGFENKDALKIFKPFQRLNGRSEYPGNGIGLAICKKITDAHRGLLYANGYEKNGCVFVLILPQTR